MRAVNLALTLLATTDGLHIITPMTQRLPVTRSVAITMQVQEQEQDEATAAMTMLAVMDLDGNGAVSQEELREFLAKYSYTESASVKIFNALDTNGDGEISLSEFSSLASLAKPVDQPQLAAQVDAEADEMFDEIDINGDGDISSSELTQLLRKRGYTAIASDAVLRTLDINNDGVLSRDELRTGFRKYSALRLAVVALVKELVMAGRWSPSAKPKP